MKDEPINPLVGDIVTAMFSMSTDNTSTLLDIMKLRIQRTEATLCAIRIGVESLINGNFMPTPRVIGEALYPSEERIKAYMLDWTE